ncbi:hypothetical protein ACH4CC_35265 [Streptomyces lydicus]|uniref:hypothetical protein n=1 Tax=Streptomyces lydicus TaxID=47763 RepID=UPI0037BBC70F
MRVVTQGDQPVLARLFVVADREDVDRGAVPALDREAAEAAGDAVTDTLPAVRRVRGHGRREECGTGKGHTAYFLDHRAIPGSGRNPARLPTSSATTRREVFRASTEPVAPFRNSGPDNGGDKGSDIAIPDMSARDGAPGG